MMRDRLAHVIQLREKGRAKQDQSILEEARTLLLELVVAYPDDAEINFQAAVVHDNWDLNESPFLSTCEHSVKDFPEQILKDAYWAWEAPIVYWANTRKRRKRYV